MDDQTPDQPDRVTEIEAEADAAAVVNPPDDFLVYLAKTAPGSLDELTDAFAAVVAAVNTTGKAGSLSYKISVKPAKGIDGMVLINDGVATKIPVADRDAVGMFYVLEGGNISDYPPGQTGLFGRSELQNGRTK